MDTAEFKKLFRANYFTECYLIIQTAYFFGSKSFGQHPYIDVVEHYRNTGIVLQNDLDPERLDSAFEKIDKFKEWKKDPTKFKKKPSQFSKDTYLNNWYYGVLDVIANTLGRCINYEYEYPIKNNEISEFRWYNKFIATPRILRKEQPFEMVEWDIKSGHLSYIDLFVGSNIAKTAYENYAKKHNITRDEAKRKFQSILNWRKFRNTPKEIQEYIDTLCGFGWTVEQANRIFLEVTDAPDYLFGHWASKYESLYVNEFATVNDIIGWTRGHDAVYCLKRRDVDYTSFCTSFENEIIQFELEKTELHHDNYQILLHQYKPKKAVYFSGLRIYNVVVKKILNIVPPIVIRFKDCVPVIWHKDKPEIMRVFSVLVNLNYYQKRFYYISPKIDCTKDIHNEIINAYLTFLVLNNYNVSSSVAYLFCQHIREFILLDVVAYSRLLFNKCGSDFVPKIRGTRISLNYDNNKIDTVEEEFNKMVAIRHVEGICSKEYEIMKLRRLLEKWIVGNTIVRTKPKKHTASKDLLTKMHEIDSLGVRANLKQNSIRTDKPIDSTNESIIYVDTVEKTTLYPEIDSKEKREKLPQNAFYANKSIDIIDDSIIYGDLFSEMAFYPENDRNEKKEDLTQNAICVDKSIDIIIATIMCGDLYSKMAFCPKIDRKRTKARQQAQLKKQEKDWHKDDEKRTRQIMLAKEIAPLIDYWINYKSNYDIEYVTKYN